MKNKKWKKIFYEIISPFVGALPRKNRDSLGYKLEDELWPEPFRANRVYPYNEYSRRCVERNVYANSLIYILAASYASYKVCGDLKGIALGLFVSIAPVAFEFAGRWPEPGDLYFKDAWYTKLVSNIIKHLKTKENKKP